MQCYTCNLSSICKIFQMANDSKMTADIMISNCKMYNDQGSQPVIHSSLSPEKDYQGFKRPQRTPEQLNAVSEMIKQQKTNKDSLTATNAPTLNLSIEDDSKGIQATESKKECCVCKEMSEESKVCAECKLTVCEGCLVESLGDDKVFCETCWSNA